MSDYKSIVEHAIETAKKLGAQNARISASRSDALSIEWRKAKIETMTSSGEAGLHLALYVDGRYGAYSTSDMRPDAVDTFIDKCIKMTRLLEEDPARTLADPARYENRHADDLDLWDPHAPETTPNEIVENCKKLEELCLQHSEIPVSDVTVQYEVGMSQSVMATTNGFEGSKKSTYFYGSASMVLADGDKKPSDYDYSMARYLSDIRSPEQIAAECAHFCAMKIGQKKLPSGNRTLIFDRRVAAQMIRKFLAPLDGMSLVMKNSYFLDKCGEKLASDLFDIRDNPHIKRGMDARVYDGEGMSTRELPLFENGILRNYYISVYAGNKLGMIPTTSSPSELVLKPGTRSLEEMIADVSDGIYVTGLLGGNQDAVRGDFSHGIVGVAIENGKLTTPVSEMNITGNHLDMWKRLVEVGNDVRTDGAHRIPSIRIDDVAVSGS